MRRKYFVRGMGVGIIITVLIFTVVMLVKGDSISNEEIIARAKTLGMVEASGTATIADENESSKDEEEKNNDGKEEAKTQSQSDTDSDTKTDTDSDTDSDTKKTTQYTKPSDNTTTTTESKTETTKTEDDGNTNKKPDTTGNGNTTGNTGNTGNTVKVTISSGDSSRIVSAKLHELGLINDPKAFDSFLMNGGYDHYIHVGDYEIKKGESFESIAKSLTGR